MSDREQIDCRFCGGIRPTNGKQCLGCGAPVQNAINRNKTPKRLHCCPRCRSTKYSERADGTADCNECAAWFDLDDEGIVAVDTRPERNAEKRERRKAGRRRFRR